MYRSRCRCLRPRCHHRCYCCRRPSPRRSRRLVLIFVVMGGGSNNSGGGTSASGTGSGSDTSPSNADLRLLGSDPLTMDPALASDADSATYIVEIFGGLVTI